jgi:hypothetical protein
MSVSELACELAAAKPFLARSFVKGGAGSVPSQGTAPAPLDLKRYFGKGSSAGAEEINRLAIHDKTAYKRLRAQAVKEGLLG